MVDDSGGKMDLVRIGYEALLEGTRQISGCLLKRCIVVIRQHEEGEFNESQYLGH